MPFHLGLNLEEQLRGKTLKKTFFKKSNFENFNNKNFDKLNWGQIVHLSSIVTDKAIFNGIITLKLEEVDGGDIPQMQANSMIVNYKKWRDDILDGNSYNLEIFKITKKRLIDLFKTVDENLTTNELKKKRLIIKFGADKVGSDFNISMYLLIGKKNMTQFEGKCIKLTSDLNYSDLKDIDDDFNTQTDNFMKILGELKKTSGATIRLKNPAHKQNITFERGGVSHFIVKNGEGPDEKGFLSDFLNRFGEADDIFIFPAYAKNRNETFNTVIFSNQSNLDSQTSLVEVIYDQGQACCPPAE